MTDLCRQGEIHKIFWCISVRFRSAEFENGINFCWIWFWDKRIDPLTYEKGKKKQFKREIYCVTHILSQICSFPVASDGFNLITLPPIIFVEFNISLNIKHIYLVTFHQKFRESKKKSKNCILFMLLAVSCCLFKTFVYFFKGNVRRNEENIKKWEPMRT